MKCFRTKFTPRHFAPRTSSTTRLEEGIILYPRMEIVGLVDPSNLIGLDPRMLTDGFVQKFSGGMKISHTAVDLEQTDCIQLLPSSERPAQDKDALVLVDLAHMAERCHAMEVLDDETTCSILGLRLERNWTLHMRPGEQFVVQLKQYHGKLWWRKESTHTLKIVYIEDRFHRVTIDCR